MATKTQEQSSVGEGEEVERKTSTSIFLPSTTDAWSCSLALSASELLANVTKPKPFDPLSLKMISTSRIGPYFPNIFLKSGSLNRKGMFDTWSLLGVLSACLLAWTETTVDCESVWLTAQDWDCCWAAATAAAAAREVATSWEPSSPCKKRGIRSKSDS